MGLLNAREPDGLSFEDWGGGRSLSAAKRFDPHGTTRRNDLSISGASRYPTAEFMLDDSELLQPPSGPAAERLTALSKS